MKLLFYHIRKDNIHQSDLVCENEQVGYFWMIYFDTFMQKSTRKVTKVRVYQTGKRF